MPIIKDKYSKKGQQIRSKYEKRTANKATRGDAPFGISTEQKKQMEAENYRNNIANIQEVTSSQAVLSNSNDISISYDINHFIFSSANTASLIFKLSEGQSINDIIIHNYNTVSKDNVISLYWTIGDQDLASFTVSNGVITAFSGIPYLARIFGSNFPHSATVSLKDIVSSTFKNTNKDIYFYAVAELAGPSITYSKG